MEVILFFVKEKEIQAIPKPLEQNEHVASKMGALARSEWKKRYAKERVFTTVVDQLLISKQGIEQEFWISRFLPYVQYIEPFYFRHWIMSPITRHIKQCIIG